jgi:hypothetical protein
MAASVDLTAIIKARDDTAGAIRQAKGGFAGLKRSLGAMGTITGGLLGANLVQGLVSSGIGQVKSILTEAFDAEQLDAQTKAVLKSTKGIAGISFGNIKSLGDQMQMVTTFSDDAVQEAQNLLLTFTKVRGANFKPATQAILDMATAMGTDVQSATIAVGKALQDPVRGVTALRRAGVQLSDEQIDNIKNLVAAGKTHEAQLVVLGELQTQFGGSAVAAGKTGAGAWKRVSNQFNEVKETLGTALLPTLTKVGNKLAEFIVNHQPEIQRFADLVAEITEKGFERLSAWFTAHQADIKSAINDIVTVTTALKDGWVAIEPVVAALFKIWQNEIETKLKIIRDIIVLFNAILHGDWSKAWKALKTLANDAMDGVKKGVILRLNLLWTLIKAPVKAIKDAVVNGFEALRSNGMDKVKALKDGVVNAFKAIPGLLLALKDKFFDAAKSLGNQLKAGLKSALSATAGLAGDIASAVLQAIKSVINTQVIDRINSLLAFTIKVPGPLPDIPINPDDIPHLARGGIVRRPTLAMIGDAGPEAVIPLSRGAGRMAFAGAGGGVTVNLNISGPFMGDEFTARKLARIISEQVQRVGRLG